MDRVTLSQFVILKRGQNIKFKAPVDEGPTGSEKRSEEGRRKYGERVGRKLGENENRILEIVAKNKSVTIPELSKILDISTTAVENNLTKLKAKQFLKRIGPDKGGYWEIINV